MEAISIAGFYYDKHRNKYFRIGSGNSGQNVLTNHNLSQIRAEHSIDCYRREETRFATHLLESLRNQEINRRMKYNLREELFRSQFKALKQLKSFDLEAIDFCGNVLKNVWTQSLISSTINDKLFTVLNGDSGSAVYAISVEDVFDAEFDLNASKRIINSFPPRNKVIDISYISGSTVDLLSTLVHHFPNEKTINSSFILTAINESNETLPNRQTYEFSEPIFSATHFSDMNLLGGEKQIYVFKPSYSGNIKIIKANGKVTALKTNNDGKLFIAGTNKGQLSCFDVREQTFSINQRSSLSISDKSIVNLHILSDNNTIIASSHENNLSLLDLRMFIKPVLLYSNHVNKCHKIPINVDESVGILCSSGDDHLVRFWSIKSGKMLYMFCPLFSDSNHNNQLPSSKPISQVQYSHSWKCLNGQFKPLIFSLNGNHFSVITNGNLEIS